MIVKNASRATVLGEAIEVAATAAQRAKGLLGRDCLSEGEGLLFKGCSSLHTFFMQFPIDVIYADKEGKVLKVAKEDRVIGFAISRSGEEGLTVVRDNGTEIVIRPRNYRVTSRAGKGFEVIKRGRLEKALRPKPVLPDFLKQEGGEENGRSNGSGRNGGETQRGS